MYKSFFILLIVLLSSFNVVNDIDRQVVAAAESQLPFFIARIPAGQETSYGFKAGDDLDLCSVGKPFRMLQFSEDFYRSALNEDNNYIVIKNEWKAPVTINGENRTLLTVNGTQGNYYVSGIGDTVLAKELQQQSEGANENDEFYILRIPRLRADFFVSESHNSFSEAHFVPLLSAIVALPSLSNTNKTSFTLMEVENTVKETLLKRSQKP